MKQYLSVKQIAARTKQPYETIRSLAGRKLSKDAGEFPLPACIIGERGGRTATYGWETKDVDRWFESYSRNKPHSRSGGNVQ